MLARQRADRLLVQRGLFESRAKAQAAIEAGLVTADATIIRRASDEIDADAVLHAKPAHPWVSRGGVKLDAALARFGFDPAGRVCLDVGTSTGGFAQVLLARGAQRIYAVDVGRDQLHPSLKAQPEIVSFEQTDIRSLDPGQLPQLPDLVTIDVSFISLKLVLQAALALAQRPAQAMVLVKPQFEVGRGRRKKGIVRDPALQAQVCGDISAVLRELDWNVIDVVPSPIVGSDGNREFLLGAVG